MENSQSAKSYISSKIGPKQMEQSRLEFVPGIRNDGIEYLLTSLYFQNILQKWQLFIMTSKNLAFSTRVCISVAYQFLRNTYLFGIQITHTNQPSTQHFHEFLAVSFKN